MGVSVGYVCFQLIYAGCGGDIHAWASELYISGVRGELVISERLLIQSHIVIVINRQSVDIFEYIAIVNYKVLYVFAVAIYIVVKTLIGRSTEAVKTWGVSGLWRSGTGVFFDELGIAEPKHSKSAYHKDESRHHSQTSQGVASAAVYFYLCTIWSIFDNGSEACHVQHIFYFLGHELIRNFVCLFHLSDKLSAFS